MLFIVGTTHQTALTVLPHEDAPARGKRPRHFPHFVFFFFQFFFSRRSRCCVVPAGALVISLRLLLTTKMVSMHIHFRLRVISSPSSVFSVLYGVFLFLVINRSVAGVVCPVAEAHYPVAGVILTVVEENHPVPVVACPVARVMQNCVAQVASKFTVIGSLVDCPLACRIVADHSLMSGHGVMHSPAGIMRMKLLHSFSFLPCL